MWTWSWIRRWLVGWWRRTSSCSSSGTPLFGYALGWGVAQWQGRDVIFEALPPLFWPIVVGSGLVITTYHGYVVPAMRLVQHRRQAVTDLAAAKAAQVEEAQAGRQRQYAALLQQVEATYAAVTAVYKPETLNPQHPGNTHAMQEIAQNQVDLLLPVLRGLYQETTTVVPPIIDVVAPDSLRQWYDFLRRERVAMRGGLRYYQQPVASAGSPILPPESVHEAIFWSPGQTGKPR